MTILSKMTNDLPRIWFAVGLVSLISDSLSSIHVFALWLVVTGCTYKVASWKTYVSTTLLIALFTNVFAGGAEILLVLVVNLMVAPLTYSIVPALKALRIKLIQRSYRVRTLKEASK